MIDFLHDVNILDEVIEEIIKNNSNSTLYDLSCNEEECIKIINYLKEIGILNIDELLIKEIDVFKLNLEDIVKKFSKFNIPIYVKMINNDYTMIEQILMID